MTAVKYREVKTSIHGEGFHFCGVSPKPDETPVRLDRDYHPGFGGMRLVKNRTETIWSPDNYKQSRQLRWIDKHILDNDAVWTLEVEEALASFVLIRRKPGVWVVESSGHGFA